MDLMQRELTKLAAASVIVNEMALASNTQKTASMDKEALNTSLLRQKFMNMMAMMGSPNLDFSKINSALEKQVGSPSKSWLSKRGLEFSIDSTRFRPTRGYIPRNSMLARMNPSRGVDPLLAGGWYDALMSAARPGRVRQWFTPYPKADRVTWTQAIRSILNR